MSKPQSLAFGLNDSPAGLAPWMLSFVDTGAADHDVEAAFGGRDDLLTNLTLCWVTQTAGPAARMYLEDARANWGPAGAVKGARSDGPAAAALFPREAPTPRAWAERHANLRRFTSMPARRALRRPGGARAVRGRPARVLRRAAQRLAGSSGREVLSVQGSRTMPSRVCVPRIGATSGRRG